MWSQCNYDTLLDTKQSIWHLYTMLNGNSIFSLLYMNSHNSIQPQIDRKIRILQLVPEKQCSYEKKFKKKDLIAWQSKMRYGPGVLVFV